MILTAGRQSVELYFPFYLNRIYNPPFFLPAQYSNLIKIFSRRKLILFGSEIRGNLCFYIFSVSFVIFFSVRIANDRFFALITRREYLFILHKNLTRSWTLVHLNYKYSWVELIDEEIDSGWEKMNLDSVRTSGNVV